MAKLLNKTFQIFVPNKLFLQQKRFRGKINIQKPRKPHYTRALVDKFLTPFYENPKKDKTSVELCSNPTKVKEKIYHPYEQILAREVLNWFNNSKMIAFVHRNSMTQLEQFELAVPLKRNNMYLKRYTTTVMNLALENSPYKILELLYRSYYFMIFSPEQNVTALEKILKKHHQVILMGGILEGRLLSANDFLRYGKLDLTSAQTSLVHTLQSAGGNVLHQQITHHQSTLVNQLQQIAKNTSSSKESNDPISGQ